MTTRTINRLLMKFARFIKTRVLVILLRVKRGAVLIEFAAAIPILVMVLYCSLDVPSVYRISSKLQKTSELYAQMLINVAKSKKYKITADDLKDISRSVGLTFTGVYKANDSMYPFNLSTYITLIEGIEDNKFEIRGHLHIVNNLQHGTITNDNDDYTYSTISSESDNAHIGNLQNLVILQDEIKLLIETVVWYDPSADSRGFNKKFYLLTVPGATKGDCKTLGDKTAIVSPPEEFEISIVNNPSIKKREIMK